MAGNYCSILPVRSQGTQRRGSARERKIKSSLQAKHPLVFHNVMNRRPLDLPVQPAHAAAAPDLHRP